MSITSTVPRRIHWPVLILCFLAVLLDGLDTATLAFAIPTMAQEWGIDASAFTLALVLTNIGVVIGYMSSGFLGARVGNRVLLIWAVLLFAVATILTAATLGWQSMPALIVLRFVTGLGLGMTLPAGIALATRHSPPARREMVSVAVALGLAFGTAIGGSFGGRLLDGVGTSGVFWIAGVLPLVLAPIMAWLLPRRTPEAAAPAHDARQEAKVSRLFVPSLRVNTVLIWTFSFLVFVAGYTLLSWTPTLLLDYGFSATQAPLGLAVASIGGIVGGLLLIPLTTKIGIARSLIVLTAVGAVCLAVVGAIGLAPAVVLLVLGGAGLGVLGSQIGQLTLAVAVYPVGARTTGVGWAAALGRIGSIVGPGLVGLLLALALSGQNIIVLAAVPVVVALLCAVALGRRTRAVAGPELVPSPAAASAAASEGGD